MYMLTRLWCAANHRGHPSTSTPATISNWEGGPPMTRAVVGLCPVGGGRSGRECLMEASTGRANLNFILRYLWSNVHVMCTCMYIQGFIQRERVHWDPPSSPPRIPIIIAMKLHECSRHSNKYNNIDIHLYMYNIKVQVQCHIHSQDWERLHV